MKPEQEIIRRWMLRTMKRTGWTPGRWAKEAGIKAATTISRAVQDDYQSVTSVESLHAMAKAAGEKSILEFLEEGGEALTPPPAYVPNAETLATILAAVLPLLGPGRPGARSLRVVGAALESGLTILEQQHANGEEPALGVAARAAVARFRDLTQQ